MRSRTGGESSITYLDEAVVEDVRQTKPPLNRSQSGYGNKIGTSWELKIDGRWHRVYVIQWSNAGSAYVLKGGKSLFLGSFDPSWWLEQRGRR